MGLRSDRTVLRTQLTRINSAESDIGDFNRKLDSLIEELRDTIISNNSENLIAAVDGLRDNAGANGRDSNLTSAESRIEREISVISAAIRAQEEAARAMREAAAKSGG